MKATVLVVEDEEKLRRVIELQLKTAGYEVEQAGSAEDALKLADRADLILTDLRLPGISGLELLDESPPPGYARAGDRHDSIRKHRDRSRGDEGRRSRFSPQAVFARSPHDRGEQSAGS